MHRIIVITGTDTGAGKTVLTALLASHLRARRRSVAALKPICSGGRGDARMLRRAAPNALTLDEINPWHFRAPLAPLLAARMENQRVELREVAAHVHAIAHRHDTTLVEGAGGLLSPLGEGFSTRELIGALSAEVIVVAPNQLGAVSHVRLTFEGLPRLIAARARLAFMSPARSNQATETNIELLAEFLPPGHITVLPRFRKPGDFGHIIRQPAVQRQLEALLS